ncbi:hypothetical protein BGZ83_007199 [Gryganskiella cystojenkinii]|nr:hypothetical protein BGZ83_007199 [Gryganskiella cystojenkinii]
MSSSAPPVPIEPSDILSFAGTTPLLNADPDEPPFLQLFHDLFPASPRLITGTSPATVRMYIVQQPIPAKHRRSYVEVKDLRGLCGRPIDDGSPAEKDLKDAMIVMRKIPFGCNNDPVGALFPQGSRLSPAQVDHGSTSSGSSSGGNSDWSNNNGGRSRLGIDGSGSGYSSMTEDSNSDRGSVFDQSPNPVFSSGRLGVTMEIFEPQPYLTSDVSNQNPVLSMDDELGNEYDDGDDDDYDDSEDEDFTTGGKHPHRLSNRTSTSTETIKPSRKFRCLPSSKTTKNSSDAATLPEWFRAKTQDGRILFEVWVVAFLITPPAGAVFSDVGSEAIKRALVAPEHRSSYLGSPPSTSSSENEHRPVMVHIPDSTSPAPPTSATPNQPSDRQSHVSIWIEQVAQFLGSKVLESFVRSEVAQSKIGIDFKKILLDQKNQRQRSSRRVIR